MPDKSRKHSLNPSGRWSRRELLAAGLGLPMLAAWNSLAAAGPQQGARRAARRPNIVVILADDQGWGDLSIHGNRNLSTPNIDSLAREGVIFERFYACAVCAPTRAEFLTGRYHPRGGVRGVTQGLERLNLGETTIAETFRASGYATGAFGKWHNGSQFPYHPNARGFEEYYGFTSGHWGQYFDADLDHNGTPVKGKGYMTDDLTDHAVRFIEQNRERQFFCYLPFNAPHSPWQVPDRFFRRFAEASPAMRGRDPKRENLAETRAALAMCENIDWNVGRVLAALRQMKLSDNTIVVYFSDNGPNTWRWNGGMKGIKASVDEGGLRVPCLVRWPGQIRPGVRIPHIAGAIDLLPTLADMAGVPLTGGKPLDGKSLRPLLLGESVQWPDRMIFSLQRRRISVRTQQYRLDSEGRLFDMEADPLQDRDVSREKPEVAARLRQAVAEWAKEMLPLVGPDDRPFPVGYAATTMLPARDGEPGGAIQRSAQAPNCSYFTNWTSTDDRMTWDIEVAAAGRYDAVIYYTCRAEDVGSTVELSFQDARAQAKIAAAHDPPLIGAAFDRVRRTQSYVKDFRAMPLGAMVLPKGRGKLALRALDVAGKQVADIRYVSLTRA